MWDCFFTGMPCQAWTRLRDKRSGASPCQHPGWKVTFQDFFEILDSSLTKILGGIAEQVMGFADAGRKSTSEALEGEASPFALFLKKLRSRGYFVTTVRLNLSTWLSEPARDGLYIIYVSRVLGGQDALRWIERAIQD